MAAGIISAEERQEILDADEKACQLSEAGYLVRRLARQDGHLPGHGHYVARLLSQRGL